MNESTGGAVLTIGMPVYNNAGTLRRAVDSLLSQRFSNFNLLISDDMSTDSTWSICEQLAAEDSRIRCARQPKNVNYGNFRWLLQQAETPFFMFAAGDDRWHPDFVCRMLAALEADPGAVCAISRVVFRRGEDTIGFAHGTRPLTGKVEERIVEFLTGIGDNSRMYGIFRTPVAKRAFPASDFHAYDWAFSVGTLLEGTHIEVPDVLFWRDETDPRRYLEYVRRDARNALERVFPLLPFTKDLFERLSIPRTGRIAREIARLNTTTHIMYLKRFHRRWADIVEPFERRLTAPMLSAALRVWPWRLSSARASQPG